MKLLEVLRTSLGLEYQLTHNLSLSENIYRYSSEGFVNMFNEARQLYNQGKIQLEGLDKELIETTDIGEMAEYNGEKVPLDLPMLDEAEYQGREVPLNKPKRGGPKKFFVYVRDPKTKNVKKVNFGAEGGGQNLSVKFKEPGARASFAARHKCDQKKDKTTPGYWSCRIPRYWKSLGGNQNYSGFW